MKVKLLIVDDSVTIQKIVAMAFENENMIVQGASNGKEALEKLNDFHPDIIITDVDMPGIDGFEVSRKIRELEPFKSVPILLLTSDFEEFNETLFKRSLASDYLSKPFKSEKIVEKVNQLLDLHPTNDSELDTQSTEELTPEIYQGEGSETTETDVTPSLPSSDENLPEEKSTEEILENLKKESEKTTNIVEPEEIKSPPVSASEEVNTSTATKKPEDMTIEELLASAEALLEENYMESEDTPSGFMENSETSVDLNQINEVTEPVLQEEKSKPEILETAQDQQSEPNLDNASPALEADSQNKIDETPDSNETLTFEESLESELKQMPEDSIEENSTILEEPDLHENLEKTTEQIETNDLDDSFLYSPVSEEDPDPLVETESNKLTEVRKEWLVDETSAQKTNEKNSSTDDLLEITKEGEDDNKSQQTIDELDAVFESIQNFENHIKSVEQNDVKVEKTFSESPSLETSETETIEELTKEKTIPSSNKIESDSIPEQKSPSQKPTFTSEFSDYHISPEPDNLLEKLAPAAFDSPGTEGRPDLIQETLAYLSELTPEPSKTKPKEKTKPAPSEKKEIHMNSEPIGDMFVKVVGEHVKRILERSLEETIAREISGLSKTIERSVKEVVKEVTPEITRSIIQEEIEKIRKLEEV